ncbi:MAG: sigma-70 family RNA polymerase sigma factor [Magnetococcales bacterium]|nr:sigma-70 family RNA polymerase sigma factor [Magnetococcales bacterium]
MSVQTFINKCIKNTPTFSAEEELKLFKKYQLEDDLKARETIIESHILMVATLAQNFARIHRQTDFYDLFQVGLIGLLRATDNFDLSRESRFANYAKQWIMREIQIAVRKQLRMAYVPITTQREKIFAQTIKHRKKTSDVEELIELIKNETGISHEIVKDMVSAILTTDISLNTNISSAKHNILPEDNSELVDIIPSQDPSPEEHYQQKELAEIIQKALATLKESEESVIIGKYFAEKSNAEISAEINRGIVSMLNLELKVRKKLAKKLQDIKNYR